MIALNTYVYTKICGISKMHVRMSYALPWYTRVRGGIVLRMIFS